ncbi:hypothetical protein [Burkholderia phage FLC9]|nr:hypothetical protein [Burkholderia phage FLC9]
MLHETYFNTSPTDPVKLEPGNKHRKINFDLCTAIDLTKMSIVLDDLVAAGMHPNLAHLYKIQADALLQQLRSENNRIHGL